jgi:hypothetical protein
METDCDLGEVQTESLRIWRGQVKMGTDTLMQRFI